jgi:hypothetical protein
LARKVGMGTLFEGGEAVLTESEKEIPHATGTMQRTGTVTDAPEENAVYISFNTPYAVRQHEDLTLRHPDPRNPLSTPGRKAKFLEDPFNRLKDKIFRLADLRVKKALQDVR